MEPFTPLFVASLIMSSPNKTAQEQAMLATYKQSGLEKMVNNNFQRMVDKEQKDMLFYSYQIIRGIQNKEVTIGFSF